MSASSGQPKIGGFFKRDKILSEIELDNCTEEMSESDDDDEEEGGEEEKDKTLNDADNILNGLEHTIESVLSYLLVLNVCLALLVIFLQINDVVLALSYLKTWYF